VFIWHVIPTVDMSLSSSATYIKRSNVDCCADLLFRPWVWYPWCSYAYKSIRLDKHLSHDSKRL